MKKKILIVDDDINYLKFLERHIKWNLKMLDLKADIDEGFDGSDLSKKIKNNYDIIFTDEVMGYTNGIEAVRRVRAIKKYKEIPIYIVSYDKIEKSAIKAGATGYINKGNINMTINGELYNILKKELSEKHQ